MTKNIARIIDFVSYISSSPEKPSVVQCTMGSDALTFPNTVSNGVTTDGCSVSKNYQQITFASCTQTEPDGTDGFHMAADSETDATKVMIKKSGYYRVELTALLTTTRFVTRADVFKQTTKDPESNCATITSTCSGLLQLRGQGTVDDNSYSGSRSTNGAGIFALCPGDEIVVIASKSGNLATSLGTVEGGPQGIRTILTVTKAWHE